MRVDLVHKIALVRVNEVNKTEIVENEPSQKSEICKESGTNYLN